MKKLVIIPEFIYNKYISIGKYMPLLNGLVNDLKFEFMIVEDIDGRTIDADIVFLLKGIWKQRPYGMHGLTKLPKGKKLIALFSDLHGDKPQEDHLRKTKFYSLFGELMDRCDKILCPYDGAFRKKWSEFIPKFEFFPHFAEYKNAIKPINDKPILQCLLSGIITGWYPLRTIVYKYYLENKRKEIDNIIQTLSHPGYYETNKQIKQSNKFKIGDDYHDELSKYYCSVTCSSIIKYLLGKYFEIPASGSLLLGEDIPDLDLAGFIDDKNYIKVNQENVINKIKETLTNPQKYNNIRKEGKEFIIKNHTEKNRIKRIEEIIKDL